MWAKVGQAFLKYLALPLIMEIGRGLVGWIGDLIEKWREARRKAQELKRQAAMSEALDRLVQAETEKEIADAQSEVVANRPRP